VLDVERIQLPADDLHRIRDARGLQRLADEMRDC
jgi:hypothetical protein